jgi:hypothetical protein
LFAEPGTSPAAPGRIGFQPCANARFSHDRPLSLRRGTPRPRGNRPA